MALSKIKSNSITTDAITSDKIAAGVVSASDVADATLTGAKLVDSTITNDKLVDSTLTLTKLSATGTKDATTFLRGDNTFAAAGLAWQAVVVADGSTGLTVVAGRGYWIDTTAGTITITLPASATNGDTIILVDYARNWGTNKITINQNSLNFQGNTSPNPEYNTSGQSVTLVYSGATQGWIPTVDDDVTLETPQSYSIDFLVVAGGGAGPTDASPSWANGGGGAGGFRTSTQSVIPGTAITVTVGDGGSVNSSGSNSSISGSGLTTVTSAGGGKGSSGAAAVGGNGGSGGGGGGDALGGSGNTPSTSPSQGNNGGRGYSNAATGGGGGGGAGAIGSDATVSSVGGNGGNGTSSSITGSSVTYAGGGGGGAGYPPGNGTGGTGGSGGGGNGRGDGAGNAGTANTGGGGGGGKGGTNGAAGGKGVVILSMLTTKYSGTTSGSPAVTTSGSNTILQFNGSGSYTA